MKPEVPKERINEEITSARVRLITENGEQMGVVSLSEALKAAEKAGLDLVEVSPNAKPPVCKIINFGHYHYQKERKMRESRKKQHIVQTKEIKFGPNTEEHDFNFKKNNAIKFLKQHNKVKLTVRFKGRQLAHKELGYKVLEKLQEDLKEIAEVDGEPKSEGRTIFITVSPKKDIDRFFAAETEETTIEKVT
ncbi:MAG: translation initiation factor IF-3 [Candidatus Cloacimonetes bacterium]|nr:translation initiation factor IF-3 [Candidatus Cloacimonadota bacterium]